MKSIQKIIFVISVSAFIALMPLGLHAQENGNEALLLPPLMVNVEQLSWDTFRFIPSFRLGETESQYRWHFGDSTQSDDRVVEHNFPGPGVYNVELGLIDKEGTPYSAAVQVNIGFFNLANWRLWLLIGLLALIIIIVAVIAGVRDNIVSDHKDRPRCRS